MVELISRERARHEFALFFQDSKNLVDDCDSLLCMLPTIDAVPVVRCGECEKRDKDFVSSRGTVSCPYMEAFMPSDGFCSYGVRKDGDG